ncbi:MAG: Na+/H+ antiporter subunit E [Gemmatimonadota bacterium]
MLRAAILFLLLFGVWLALSGHYTPLLITLGLLCSAGIVLLALRMRIVDDEGLPLGMAPRFVAYIPWLLLETIRSNMAVAKVILSPSLPISPVLLRFRARTKTELGRFLFGNSITFTPGTTTCEIDGEDLVVYALTRDSAESLQEGEMVRRVCWVEGSE